jgi:hypothetical protein
MTNRATKKLFKDSANSSSPINVCFAVKLFMMLKKSLFAAISGIKRGTHWVAATGTSNGIFGNKRLHIIFPQNLHYLYSIAPFWRLSTALGCVGNITSNNSVYTLSVCFGSTLGLLYTLSVCSGNLCNSNSRSSNKRLEFQLGHL